MQFPSISLLRRKQGSSSLFKEVNVDSSHFLSCYHLLKDLLQWVFRRNAGVALVRFKETSSS